MSLPMSRSQAASQPGLVDPIETFIDFTEYDGAPYQSPSLSSTASIKTTVAPPIKAEPTTPASLLSASQPLRGPSHQYDLYKQQTGLVPGALATTLAVNQNPPQFPLFAGFGGLDYLGMESSDDLFDFNTAPSQGAMSTPDMDMGFDSPSPSSSNPFEATVNPNSIGGQEPDGLSPSPLSAHTSNVGRLWPGMHQQAAMAKAQQQQRAQAQTQQQTKQTQKSKSPSPSDPLVERKISQLLSAMRAKPAPPSPVDNVLQNLLPRPKKDESEMDEDEKLLASEEGKKLSGKERRQLRNKVSARNFRSRRKDYISELEKDVVRKAQDIAFLRSQNKALIDENKRLSDLARMLLSSPSFSDFLDNLSSNPQMTMQPEPQPQQPQQPQQQQDARQVPKDVNPYAAQQVLQQQQIGLATIPEQPVDYSMLNVDSMDGFSYQPQVYAVLETPEPAFDVAVLSGKTTTTFVGEQFDSEDEKAEMPVIECPAPIEQSKEEECAPRETASPPATAPSTVSVAATLPIDEEFENDPLFALYNDPPAASEPPKPMELDTEGLSQIDIFGGIELEKAFARLELVTDTEGDEEAAAREATARLAMARVQSIKANLDSLTTGLELMVGL
ncbi:hypothetical protein VTK56DRAFT_8812 [Thermocarpiscus australiensis]